MHFEGILSKWNDDRGFGFIAPTLGGAELFVHISAFPKDGQRPQLNERVTFEIEIGKDGKRRATNLLCPDRPKARSAHRPRVRSEKPGLFWRVAPLLFLVALAAYGYKEYSRRTTPQTTFASQAHNQGYSPSFQCDGRTHCSQMTSCSEAKYFLKNCPGVQMDGNNDGEPCEQQWCTSFFAK